MDTAIIKVCQDEADNTGTFAKMSDSYFDLITIPTGWLLCDIIQQAQVLLQLQNMAIHGFQRTTLGPVKNCDSHCLCISSAGYLPGHVNLYDSLTVLSQKIEEQANDLLGGRKEVLSPMKVQQQRNTSDCGVFAIAFSNCLAFGEDPTFVNFDVLRVRSHLAECLRNGRISLFSSF